MSPPSRDCLGGPAAWSLLDDDQVETPALVVDLERTSANIRRAQEYCNGHGLRFRPHIKTHKLPLIAEMQVAAGAVGVTCQTLAEAEVMADSGIADILITYPILGARKVHRLAKIAAVARVSVAADSAAAVEACSEAASQIDREIGFLVECDTGMGRLGVQTSEQAAWLGKLAATTDGVRFDGLMTYPTSAGSAAFLSSCASALKGVELTVNVVSAGGTPTLYRTHELSGGVINEVRAGEYVFGDRTHLGRGVVSLDEIAAVVLGSVVGRPTATRVILDTGSKSLSSDLAGQEELGGFGAIAEYPDAVIYELSEEHAHVDVSRCPTAPQIGERVSVIPNHICSCFNLASRVVLRRASGVEFATVTARGYEGAAPFVRRPGEELK